MSKSYLSMLEQASYLAEKLEFENMLMSILIINPAFEDNFWVTFRDNFITKERNKKFLHVSNPKHDQGRP